LELGGSKLYPSGGYAPGDERLLGLYALCEERGVPVMMHCSPGGVWQYGLTPDDRRRLCHPSNYEALLTRFPKLRLCLAHFGGSEEWDMHLRSRDERAGDDRAWVTWIADLIRDGAYPNLYTDISYLIFQAPGRDVRVSYMDYVKVLLADLRLREHVLFGSDYYMVEREDLTKKEVSTCCAAAWAKTSISRSPTTTRGATWGWLRVPKLAQANDHIVGLPIIQGDADAPIAAGREAFRPPVVIILLAIPAIDHPC
jgi:hypothetical protein